MLACSMVRARFRGDSRMNANFRAVDGGHRAIKYTRCARTFAAVEQSQ